jgi:hypothetical protein
MSLKETQGKITYIHTYESKYYSPKENKEIKTKRIETYYQYNLNGIKYNAKRLSNLIIFPNLNLEVNKEVTVYYCEFIPKYSVLFIGNNKYLFYNIIPIIICVIIMYILKWKINLSEDLEIKKAKKLIKIEKNKNNDDDTIEMDDVFIEEIKNGNKSIKFLMVSNETDSMIIESILKTEQIPYKIDFYTESHEYRNDIFFILEKDYIDALFILEEYMKTKTKIEKEKIIIYKKQYGT